MYRETKKRLDGIEHDVERLYKRLDHIRVDVERNDMIASFENRLSRGRVTSIETSFRFLTVAVAALAVSQIVHILTSVCS